MTHRDNESIFALSCDCSSSSSQRLVTHLHHALGSDRKKPGTRRGSTEETQNTESDDLLVFNIDGPVVNHDDAQKNSEELLCYTDLQYKVRLARKHCMRDQFGDIVPNKRRVRSQTSITKLPSLKWNVMEAFSRVTLNIRSLMFGTENMNFRGPITISVSYIKIPGRARIAASQLISCEWCTAQRLPALFLQVTAAECYRLRDNPSMFTGARGWNSCQSQKEKYIVMIFEDELTMLEKATLEEIFVEIGRLNYVSNFPSMLTFEEANNRLMTYEESHRNETVLLVDESEEFPLSPFTPKMRRFFSTSSQSEMATVHVSDSEDDNDNDEDLMGCPSSQTQPAKILVVYPPPPAKGGFSVTKEDLSCLDEGEFLNDVIVDFYLKYLVCEKISKEDANRCHVFSSFFYKSLTQKDHLDTTGLSIQEWRHSRVKTWTRHLDLFKKDFIFVPINQSAHWYLAVICFPGHVLQCSAMDPFENDESIDFTLSPSLPNPMSLFYRQTASKKHYRWNTSIGELDKGICCISDDDLEDGIQYAGSSSANVFNITSTQPCILIMDSLGCHSKPTVVKVLQEYLEMEWWTKNGSWQSFTEGAMNGWSLQVPQQDNHTDCGVYLLQYVESFITNPPRSLYSDMDLSNWFPQMLVKKKREKIKELIFGLQQQQQQLDLED